MSHLPASWYCPSVPRFHVILEPSGCEGRKTFLLLTPGWRMGATRSLSPTMNWSLITWHCSSLGLNIQRGRIKGNDVSIASVMNLRSRGLTVLTLISLSLSLIGENVWLLSPMTWLMYRDGGLRKWSWGRNVANWDQRMNSSGSGRMLELDGTPPMGPGLINGYPMTPEYELFNNRWFG